MGSPLKTYPQYHGYAFATVPKNLKSFVHTQYALKHVEFKRQTISSPFRTIMRNDARVGVILYATITAWFPVVSVWANIHRYKRRILHQEEENFLQCQICGVCRPPLGSWCSPVTYSDNAGLFIAFLRPFASYCWLRLNLLIYVLMYNKPEHDVS